MICLNPDVHGPHTETSRSGMYVFFDCPGRTEAICTGYGPIPTAHGMQMIHHSGGTCPIHKNDPIMQADLIVRYPQNLSYGCVDCGSDNHTTGDKNWCRAVMEIET